MINIHSKRVLIRPIHSKDALEVFSYRSNFKVNKYQNWIPSTMEEVNRFIDKNPNAFNEPHTWFQLVIEKKDSHKVIGDIGVHFEGEQNLQCELGCTINEKYQHQGFASEALKAVIDYLFHHLKKHRVKTSIDPNNLPSIQLMERLNFRKEAHFRENLYFKRKWIDDVRYAMLQKEWMANKG